MAYSLVVPGSVQPHGYCRCWLPPAAAYSRSDSLGRNPPSQMQNAYDSHHVTQLMGSFSLVPADAVHVASFGAHAKLASVGATWASSDVTQPISDWAPASVSLFV